MSSTKHSFADDAGNNNGSIFNSQNDLGYSDITVNMGAYSFQPNSVTPFDTTPEGITVSGYTDDMSLYNFLNSYTGYLAGFNSAGAVGYYFPSTTSDISAGFIYSNGTVTSISDPNATPFNVGSGLLNLSANGQYALGYWTDSNYNNNYFVYNDGTFEELPTPPQAGSDGGYYVGVNSSGEIAGIYNDGTGFVDDAGNYTTIADPTVGATNTIVNGLDDNGDVYGYYSGNSGSLIGFVESNGTYTDVSDPDTTIGTFVQGITPDGLIYGYYVDSNFDENGFIDDNGVFTTVDDPNDVNGSEILSMDNAGDIFGVYYDSDDNPHPFTATESLCYLRGTSILTPNGEVAVEDLRIGDRVVTRQGGFRAIKWIGRQSFAKNFLGKDPAKLPVRIRAGALGPDVPARDLYVSPGHSMLVEGTLLLASTLVNGVTITHEYPETMAQIDYFQPELESHDCILAEGAWSETFADGPGLRDAYHNAGEFRELYPDYRTPEAIMLCAPRPERGAALDAALRPLVARASAGLAPGELLGSVDRVRGREIDGWACDASHPQMPVPVEVVLGDKVIHTALACDFRPDLKVPNLGLGRCAFFLTLPQEIPAGSLHTLKLRRATDGALLPMNDAPQAACALSPELLLAA